MQVPDADPVHALWLIKYDQLVGNYRNTVCCAGTIYQTRSELKVMRCGSTEFSVESHDFSRWECVKLPPLPLVSGVLYVSTLGRAADVPSVWFESIFCMVRRVAGDRSKDDVL